MAGARKPPAWIWLLVCISFNTVPSSFFTAGLATEGSGVCVPEGAGAGGLKYSPLVFVTICALGWFRSNGGH
jgi:hypothetical protein